MKETFKELYDSRHEYAREWKKKTGGKVMGYFCTYVPEEILYAAAILPVRILGSHEPQDLTEPHIFGMFCPFCRDCLAQGLKGKYDYLDGIMIAQSCLHIRQAYTSWEMHIPVQYSYYLCAPHHVQSPRAVPFLAGELQDFKKSLEGWLGRKITEADLDTGIGIMNKNRTLLRRLYELRKQSQCPVTGLEAMYAVVSSQLTDKTEHSLILEEVLKTLEGSKSERPAGNRLMLIGSENDDTQFVKMVESLGATFVVDDHCTGSRYIWEDVPAGGDRLAAIAQRYIKRVPCPTKDWPLRNRLPHILRLARDYKVEGVILLQQKFCDPHELDTPAIKKMLEENGIPTLFLELDVTVPVGQFKVRVEAFLEMFQSEVLF
ncbi:MAG: benzoyl-CoA reductase, bzd-type, subunit N [Elusimicrobia bacterium]|nr:benzoyl-CoA reductase, bzd-type, subunit N [Elusimicrobiota bacterium]